ncbi:hypothetical protein IF129_10285 [Streptomyces chumphonensis]|uniref:Uncharacterized protein n=1 Tax=Streptomyces chumphonensis TaxID=1214925 RepID=A0A927EYT8_9ACTN|nr:hypothetical protein [Streptomyces chumphonensis]MBD3931943.1 hypothetical protein [Streptomyces chumphonensis]
MKLQLSGQREDALWQSLREAHAAYYAQLNQVRMDLGHVISLFEMSARQARSLTSAGFGTREEALGSLQASVRHCWYQQCLLRLSVPRDQSARAEEVNEALSAVMHAVHPWCAERSAGQRDTQETWARVQENMALFRSAIDQYADEAQQWLAEPRAVGWHAPSP